MAAKAKTKKAPAKQKRMGRPAHEVSEELQNLVRATSGFGLTNEEVAEIAGMSSDTLVKYYSHELAAGIARRNIAVTRALFANATTSNNVAAQIWWTKTRMGWRESPQRIEIESLRDMALELASEFNLTADEAITEVEAMLAANSRNGHHGNGGNGNGNGH